jgi:hypothetical protein
MQSLPTHFKFPRKRRERVDDAGQELGFGHAGPSHQQTSSQGVGPRVRKRTLRPGDGVVCRRSSCAAGTDALNLLARRCRSRGALPASPRDDAEAGKRRGQHEQRPTEQGAGRLGITQQEVPSLTGMAATWLKKIQSTGGR